FGPRGRLGEPDDRHRRGVRGQDRLGVGDDLIEFGEDRLLDLLVLAGGFDYELPAGQIGDVGGEAQPAQGRRAGGFVELALLHGAVQRFLDPGPAGSGRLLVYLTDDHGESGLRQPLRGCGSPETAADDAGALNAHKRLLRWSGTMAAQPIRARNQSLHRMAFIASRRRSFGSVWT